MNADVDLLREAAKTMRERAEAAEPGPWSVHETHGRDIADEAWSLIRVQAAGADVAECAFDEIGASYPALENAEHIASWHPAVALAVADLLHVLSWMPSFADPTDLAVAVKLARAYLGRQP